MCDDDNNSKNMFVILLICCLCFLIILFSIYIYSVRLVFYRANVAFSLCFLGLAAQQLSCLNVIKKKETVKMPSPIHIHIIGIYAFLYGYGTVVVGWLRVVEYHWPRPPRRPGVAIFCLLLFISTARTWPSSSHPHHHHHHPFISSSTTSYILVCTLKKKKP